MAPWLLPSHGLCSNLGQWPLGVPTSANWGGGMTGSVRGSGASEASSRPGLTARLQGDVCLLPPLDSRMWMGSSADSPAKYPKALARSGKLLRRKQDPRTVEFRTDGCRIVLASREASHRTAVLFALTMCLCPIHRSAAFCKRHSLRAGWTLLCWRTRYPQGPQ
jgi:hypothetical protein